MAQYGSGLRLRESGFSLVELMIYLAILGILMTVMISSFIKGVSISVQQSRISDTEMETGMALNLLRADLEHAGFGLPWQFPVGVLPNPYLETTDSPASAGNDAILAPLADAPSGVPRALASLDNVVGNDPLSATNPNTSDYLVIKGTNVARGATCQKWGWVGRDAAHAVALQSMGPDTATKPLDVNDRVIVIRPVVGQAQFRELIMPAGGYETRGNAFNLDAGGYAPPQTANDPRGDRYLVYGIDDGGLNRPFNRVDYYISNANVPDGCASGTGVLMRATMNQSPPPLFDFTPIMDCVADFQVVYYLDTNGDGGWDTLVDANGLDGLTAAEIRSQVKRVDVYILAHEGGIDRSYLFPNPNKNVGPTNPAVADPDSTAAGVLLAGRAFNLQNLIGGQWANYRWKVYTVTATPRNLQ